MQVHYEEFPRLAKQETLFIHGNLGSTAWWKPTMESWRLAGSLGKNSLICADWRGCGRNAEWGADKPFTLEDLAADFLNLLELRKQREVALVGHSLGGLIALKIMAMDPSRISRAVLLDPVGAKGVVFDESMYEAFRQMALSRELTKTVILSTIVGQEALPQAFTEELAKDAFKAVQGIGSSVLEILKSVDLTQEAAQIQVPALILHGRLDQIIPLKDSEELARIMPNAELEILESAGHCWNVENAPAFTQRLRDWL